MSIISKIRIVDEFRNHRGSLMSYNFPGDLDVTEAWIIENEENQAATEKKPINLKKSVFNLDGKKFDLAGPAFDAHTYVGGISRSLMEPAFKLQPRSDGIISYIVEPVFNSSGSVFNPSRSVYNLSGSIFNLSGCVFNLYGSTFNFSKSIFHISASTLNIYGSTFDLSGAIFNLSGSKVNLHGSVHNCSAPVINLSGSDFCLNNRIYGEIKVKEEIKQKVLSKDSFLEFKPNYNVEEPKNKDDYYPFESIPRGAVYILNIMFEGKKDEREGSQFDVKNTESLFTKMGYYVEVITENKLKDIQIKIDKIRTSEILWKVGYFKMVLMSHGIIDCLMDIENREMNIFEVFQMPFSPQKCPALKNKPKIFIIQACRGDTVHSCKEDDTANIVHDNSKAETTVLAHERADFYRIFSTPTGYKSVRFSHTGSLFIRTYLVTIEKFGHKKSLSEIATIVNDVMSSIIHYNVLQVLDVRHSMLKEIFHNPCSI